jgi:hypothetical protein
MCLLLLPCCCCCSALLLLLPLPELFVWEDDNARTIRFTNARNDGFMKKFDGTWNVQPFTQSTLDSIYRPDQQQQQQQHGWLKPGSALSALQQRE